MDSIAITYALLDPVMTLARPVAAFATAAAAGVAENIVGDFEKSASIPPDLTCPVDGCCDGEDCPPDEHARHHSFFQKITAGLKFALTEVWGDMAGWFFFGLVLAGFIMALVPEEFMARFLGGGISSMLLMLLVGIPLYICATASTPIAAALILKGVSPGAALVFLLAGPATNITSLTVLTGFLGKRATALYLIMISVSAVLFGLALDWVYALLGISAQALVGQASEVVPLWLQWVGALGLLLLGAKPVYRGIVNKLAGFSHDHGHESEENDAVEVSSQGASSDCASPT